jgi:hypothetical protein
MERKVVPMGKAKLLLPTILMMAGLWTVYVFAQAEWTLKKKTAGIEVYVREVPGSKLREFKGTMVLQNTRLTSLVAAFDDPSTYTSWMYEVIDAKLLKRINLFERVTYTVTRAPWPVWNRDLVSHSLISQDPKTCTVTIRLTGKADYIPPVPKTIRVPKMNGLWTFQPLDTGEVMVTYQMHSEPGGDLPPELANMAVVDLPYNTLLKLRDFIKQEKYANMVYPQIREPKRPK